MPELITRIAILLRTNAIRIGVLKVLQFCVHLLFVSSIFYGLSWGLIYSVPWDANLRLDTDQAIARTDARVWTKGLTHFLLNSALKYQPVIDLANEEIPRKPNNWNEKNAVFTRLQAKRIDQVHKDQLAYSKMKRSATISSKALTELQMKIQNALKEEKNEYQDFITTIEGFNLSNKRLRYMEAQNAFMVHVDIRGADMAKAQLQYADMRGANFDKSHEGDYYKPTILTGANLEGTQMDYAQLPKADISKANLKGAFLHLALLHSAKFNEANLILADLSFSNMRSAQLKSALLISSNLYHTYLSNAVLTRADLTHATLTYAHLKNAKLNNTILEWANLYSADLTGADITNARLTNADLTDATLTKADLTDAIFTNATGVTKKQILQAKWERLPKGLPVEWKLPPQKP